MTCTKEVNINSIQIVAIARAHIKLTPTKVWIVTTHRIFIRGIFYYTTHIVPSMELIGILKLAIQIIMSVYG